MAQETFRLPQALILSAPSMERCCERAYELASAALCLEGGSVPCGRCRACKKTAAGVHPDLIRIALPRDAEGNKKRQFPVDLVREMARDAIVLPNEAERKVYLIEDADKMNASAQNALLKLLEEPPARVHFLLCVTNSALLLDTVRSRCAELSEGGASARPEPEAQKAAESFFDALEKGSRLGLLRCLNGAEGWDRRRLEGFLTASRELCAAALRGEGRERGLEPGQLLALLRLLERCRLYWQANVGTKHILALLAADSPLGRRNRG